MYLVNSDQLKDIFDIDNIPEKYNDYIPLEDRRVGFSVKRKYPSTIRYIPPQTKDGKPDTVAIIHVVYKHPEESSKKVSTKKVPIFIGITPMSKYLQNHFDYNFDDVDCPTEKSIQISKRTPIPIALESHDEYVYDHNTNTLRDSKNNTISGEQILDNLFQKHCNTIHLFKGLLLRWKLGSKNVAVKICDLLIQFYKWLLKTLFGRTLEPKDPFSGGLKIYIREDMKLLKTEAINIFGYKASRNVIITFCSSVLIFYFLIYLMPIKNKIILDLAKNYLVMVCASIFLLWFLDHPLPVLIFRIINTVIRIRLKLLFMKVKM